ncbi:diguanylate cyclase [Pseudoroseomonas ludipueritiae]|uniref:diguanylate cyclase n=1 Tax=Pseudoroseomonas ludipueritiae TaxID=198093 RepID=A0ABR7R6J0_9PROT|nr:diguanylate cyclase [Pseudoroseomonas ludipueritiae]MBC9177182.1 diguanylate cyclase [Pseudoroseomonas ludipueritiae]
MSKRAVILVVDDEVSNIELLSAALEDDHEICFATSGEEALELARSVLPDLILLDVLMPGMDGYAVCQQIKADALLADVPVIFTTALGEQEAEVKGLELGAVDYVAKPISPVIVRARVRNHIEMKRMRDQLAELAVTDALTGLGNRRRLEQALQQEAGRLARSTADLSIIMLDIDFFKQFNDTYGHIAGDRCIIMVAATLNRAVRRAADLAARYGGEEFACVLPNTSHEEAMAIAHNIRDRVLALSIPHEGSTAAPYVTVSVGVATATCAPGIDPVSWIKAADDQLYQAKARGRNNVEGRVFLEAEMRNTWSEAA